MTNRKNSRRTILLLFLGGILEFCIPCSAQFPGSTKTFQGTYFSFSYPSDWTLSQNGTQNVIVQAPGSALFYELIYTTSYGGDTAQFLADEETSLSKYADKNQYSINFTDLESSLLGGSSVTAYLTGSGAGDSTLWLNAVVVGRGILLLAMGSPPQDYYADLQAWRNPITASIEIGNGTPGGSSFTLIGEWDSLLAKTSIEGRVYSVSLTFQSDGTYVYTATQSETPSWVLSVQGNYTTGPAPQNQEQALLAVNLRPTIANGTGLSGLDQQDELSRLQALGFPGIINQSFFMSWDVQGNFDMQAFGTAVTAAYQPVASSSAPAALAVVSAADFNPGPLAPGSCISIFGTFPVTASSAMTLPLPTLLSGVSVVVNGYTAPLLYVGPAQINAQIPFEVSTGMNTLTIYVNGIQQNSTTISVASSAPGIFSDTLHHAVATNQDYSLNTAGNPAHGGSYLVVYFTGQGVFTPAVATGVAGPFSPLAYTAVSTTATIAGRPAIVAFSGAAPGIAGVAQANVQVPAGLGPGDVLLVLSVGGFASHPTIVSIAP